MSEVTQDIQSESQVENTQVETNIDPYEAEAREQGWRPKEEYEGDPNKWRPAREFVERGELFGKIDHMGKELKETKKALRMLQEHHTKVKETAYTQAVNELKSLQKKHLEEGNSDGYLEATELLTDLKAEQKAREVVEKNTPNQPDPRFLAWVDRNSWYAQDGELREFADTVGLRHAQQNPEKSPEEVLKFVEGQVKRAYSEKFTNPNRNKPSAVEGNSPPAASKKSDSFELTEDERRVMQTFVRAGVMSKEEYIKEVRKLRGVK